MSPPSKSLTLTPAADLARVLGLDIHEEIGRGAQSIVYRASRGGRVFAVKVQRDSVWDAPDPEEAATRFRREAGILARIKHRALARVMDVGEIEGRQYLIMEYVEGRTLDRVLEEGPLDAAALAALARGLADGLAEVHRRGLILRDVKPRNIILDATGAPHLIDFGFATEVGGPRDPSRPALGTFVYSAPEQTGRLKRPVDGRADLYALGVVLYECATGSPPFYSSDVGELIRLHAVAPVPDVCAMAPGIGPALAAIITRLLAKDPDDRYPSALRLVADLDQLEALEQAFAEGHPVALGAVPEPPTAVFETPLVGRDAELSALRRSWHRVRRGRGEAVRVVGEAGIGKTRLLAELQAELLEAGALVLSGTCAGQARPLWALRDALEVHVARRVGPTRGPLLGALRGEAQDAPIGPPRRDGQGYDPAEASRHLIEAAAGLEPLVGRLSPRLADLLGTEPGTAPADAEQLHEAVAEFLARLATLHGAAVLLLDDMDRADEATLEVVKRLLLRLPLAPVLLVGLWTVASDEAPSPDLEAALRTPLHPEGALWSEVRLGPLSPEHVATMAADFLGTREIGARLHERLASWSGGNPFVVVEMMRAMLEGGVLRPTWGRWVIDEPRLEALELPTNALRLVTRRLHDLEPRTRRVLATAALIGQRFDLELLRAAAAGLREDVDRALTEAIEAGLVERGADGEWAFRHARIREALCDSLTDPELAAAHQAIAESLDAVDAHGPNLTLALAHHYAAGVRHGHLRRIFETCLAAGELALREHAHERARRLLAEAMRAQEEGGLPRPVALDAAYAEACLRTGRTEDAAHHLRLALGQATEPVLRCELRARLAWAHLVDGRAREALAEARAGFDELGERFPSGTPSQLVWCARYLMGAPLRRGAAPAGEGAESPQARARGRIVAQLCEVAAAAAEREAKPLLLTALRLRQIEAAAALGASPELLAATCQTAALMTSVGRLGLAERLLAHADQLARSLGDPASAGRVLIHRGLWLHASGRSAEADAILRHGLERYGNWLDLRQVALACRDLAANLVARGYFGEAWRWVSRALARIDAAGSWRELLSTHPVVPYAWSLVACLGQPGEGRELHGRFSERLASGRYDREGAAEYWAQRALMLLAQDELGLPLDEALFAWHRLGVRHAAGDLWVGGFYVVQAHARLAQLLRAEADPAGAGAGPAWRRFDAALRELRRLGGHPVFGAHAALLSAVRAERRGRTNRARRLADRADALSRAADVPWVALELAVWRARGLAARGAPGPARREAHQAVAIARSVGWRARTRALEREFDLEPPTTRHGSQPYAAAALGTRRQLEALLEVAAATAQATEPGEQMRGALDELLRILGAERAFVLLRDGPDAPLELRAGRDAAGRELTQLPPEALDVVQRVVASERPTIENPPVQPVAGVQPEAVDAAPRARSLMCAPLSLHHRTVGCVYVDSRLASGLFTRDDLSMLLAIASHIPVALETTRVASARSWQAIAANLPGVVFQLVCGPGSALSFTSVSRGAAELVGVPAERIEEDAEALLALVHPDDRSELERSLMASGETGRPWRWTGRCLRSGAVQWLQILARPERVAADVVRWDGLLLDVTDRKLAEQRSIEGEERFRVLSQAAFEGIAVLDDGRIVDVNDQFARLAGRTRAQLFGRRLEDLLAPDARDEVRQLVQTGETHPWQATLVRGDGAAVFVEGRGRSVPYQGRLVRVEAIRDMTASHQAQSALQRATRAAEQAMLAKSEFLANMSHEIRTPLAGVVSMVELLGGTRLSREQRDYLETIHGSANTLMALIDDVLDLSRIEAGRLPIYAAPFSLEQVVVDVAQMLATRAAEKGIELVLRVAPDVPARVVGDAKRAAQVVTNLVSNAVKFTEAGHVLIDLSVVGREADRVTVKIRVEDTGIGIPQHLLDHVFEKFTQVDSTPTRRYGGTGLGLAISRQLVELMGGRMGAASTPGQGSTFWFDLTLPLAEGEGVEPMADVRGLEVLVGSGSALEREVLAEALGSAGARVETAATLSEAMDVSARSPADPLVVVLDEHLADAAGLEAARALARSVAAPRLRLVLMVARGLAERTARGAVASLDAVLPKPVDRRHLRAEVARVARGPARAHDEVPVDQVATATDDGGGASTEAAGEDQAVPAPPAEGSDAPAEAGAPAPREGAVPRVLVVDDNPINRKVALKLLEKLGYRGEAATGGREALDRLARERFDVVLMDCEMPGMDGFETTRALRAREAEGGERVPVVAMTAHALAEDRGRCMEAGMDDYVAKPVRRELLAAVLARWTGRGEG